MQSLIDSYLEISHDRLEIDILDHLLPGELKHMLSRKTENMLNWSGFPFRKTMDYFDFSFQTSIDRSLIDDIISMQYIHNNKNFVFLELPCAGKTHLWVALGMRVIILDVPLYYTSPMKLVQVLKKDYDLRRME